MAQLNRSHRRAQPRPPSINLRADLTPLPLCLQCDARAEIEVDPASGGLSRQVTHEYGCQEFAALERKEARRG